MKLKTLLLTLLLSPALNAQTYVYVTDTVDIPIRSENKIQSNPSNLLRMLPSGTKLQLLSTDGGWSKVKSEKTIGWMISRYLTSVLPAKAQLQKLRQTYNANKLLIEEYKKSQIKNNIKILELEEELRELKNKYSESQPLAPASSFSNDKSSDKLDLYDLGGELSRCAGDYEFSSMIYKEILKDSAMSKLLHEHSNGWLLAGTSNYYFSGLTREASRVFSEGKKEVKITQWLSEMELLEKGNMKEFEVFMEDLNSQIKYCSSWDDTVVLSQKKLKKAWLSRPKIE